MLLSIGVPAYNAEATLKRCLKSIVSCTGFSEYELVCVDDGSTDSTLDILKSWEKQYDNIRVIHTDNRGAFLARQRIIDEARGEWIGFVDSDDVVEPDIYVRMLSELAKHPEADMAVCAFRKSGRKHMDAFGDAYMGVMDDPESLGRVLAVNPAYWNKLYRKSLAVKSICLDYSPKIMEDSLFFCSLIPYTRGVVFVGEALYTYNDSQASVTGDIGMDEVLEAERGIEGLLSHDEAFNGREGYEARALREFRSAYISLHLGVAFSLNFNRNDDLRGNIEAWRETRHFLDTRLPCWRKNEFLSIKYACNNRQIMTLYIGYMLYKAAFWPAVVRAYHFFVRITGRDMKW